MRRREEYLQTLQGSSSSPYGILEMFGEYKDYHSIAVLDYSEDTKTFEPTKELRDVRQVRAVMHKDAKDPILRYSFVHAESSRAPLDCSLEQLQNVMHHNRVMPSFLEHVFTFHEREHPHIQAFFQTEDWLSPADVALAAPQLGRSGLVAQHCFNLIGVEFEQDSQNKTPKYNYRQTAAHWSMDPKEGRSSWLILKANKIIRDTIEAMAGAPNTSGDQLTPEAVLANGLQTHLLIMEWSISDWALFLGFLAAKISKAGTYTTRMPVDDLTNDINIAGELEKRSTFPSEQPQQPVQQQMSGLGSILPSKRRTPARQPDSHSPATLQRRFTFSSPDNDGFNMIFKYEHLQNLNKLASQLHDADSILAQNRAVIQDIVERFKSLSSSPPFKHHLTVGKHHLDDFILGAQRCVRKIEHHQRQFSALQVTIERYISQFNSILEYKNMRIGEYFARHAKVSTDNMEILTIKTKQETVSIHVITVLTLFFLPATFVATFFGSDIVEFTEEGTGLDPKGWKTKWAGLSLFGLICGILTALVLCLWSAIYCITKRRRMNKVANPPV
ncbi:hypothetical protein B0I35DRAFT_475844 [Stachybotrys elegans]|uniref:CorA-like transporter domain-containing protein n=1 Tax=Stachybotrys elegans TaxID=80388 RepID=A0A8K0SXA6_9HYPO|nr:hypothetical protein B0I35DRAFT_475844 [Stachybotrys elegans]